MKIMFLALALAAPPAPRPVPPVVEIVQPMPQRHDCRCMFGEPCICGDICYCVPGRSKSYMDACRRAVRENKRLYCYVGKNVVVVPGAIAGRFVGQFPDVRGPAVVIAEPDGNGWLRIVEVQYDRPPLQTVPLLRMQSFAPPAMFRSSGGNC